MKDKLKGFSVLISRDEGSEFFASAKGDGHYFSFQKKHAMQFKRDLETNIAAKCRVVKVKVTFKVIQ